MTNHENSREYDWIHRERTNRKAKAMNEHGISKRDAQAYKQEANHLRREENRVRRGQPAEFAAEKEGNEDDGEEAETFQRLQPQLPGRGRRIPWGRHGG